MKEHPILFSGDMILALLGRRKFVTRRISEKWMNVKAGDRLWVRERWRTAASLDHLTPAFMAEACIAASYPTPWAPMIYLADNHRDNWDAFEDERNSPGKLRPSIHMPRWASRILLECEEDARRERLQDITANEALAEGVATTEFWQPNEVEGMPFEEKWWDDFKFWSRYPQISFASLWNTLHAKPGERWQDNPMVTRVGRFHIIDAEVGK